MKCCKFCEFWKQFFESQGECVKSLPVIKLTTKDGNMVIYSYGWPDTSEDDWCGEFKEIQLGDK